MIARSRVRRVLLVGQAPSKNAQGSVAFLGDSGRRLARLVGVTHSRLLYLVDTTNLLVRWPGKSGKGDAFPRAEARRAATHLVATDNHPVWLFAGHAVAGAFGLARLDYFTWTSIGTRRVVVIPHPSGVSRWWNVPANRLRARRFFLRLFGADGSNI